MNDLDKYIQDISIWRGETIETMKKLNKNLDIIRDKENSLQDCITTMKVSYENRLTAIETKLKIISAVAYLSLAGLLTLIVEFIIKLT